MVRSSSTNGQRQVTPMWMNYSTLKMRDMYRDSRNEQLAFGLGIAIVIAATLLGWLLFSVHPVKGQIGKATSTANTSQVGKVIVCVVGSDKNVCRGTDLQGIITKPVMPGDNVNIIFSLPYPTPMECSVSNISGDPQVTRQELSFVVGDKRIQPEYYCF